MTDRYDELRQAAEAATPGKLTVYDENEGNGFPRRPFWNLANEAFLSDDEDDDTLDRALNVAVHFGTKQDADFIAIAYRDVLALLTERDSLLAALKTARHDLVCSEGLRATDQTLEQMNEKVSDGVPRSDLEFTIDNTKTLAVIDAALSGAK